MSGIPVQGLQDHNPCGVTGLTQEDGEGEVGCAFVLMAITVMIVVLRHSDQIVARILR